MGNTAVAENETEQQELPNIPPRTALGELCAGFLKRKAKIAALYEEQDKDSARIMAEMKKRHKEAMKYEDPDTKTWHSFILSEGVDKLQVRKEKQRQSN